MDKVSDNKLVFISYLDDRNQVVSGFVELLEQTVMYVKFKTDRNIVTIPYSRLLKIKQKNEEEK